MLKLSALLAAFILSSGAAIADPSSNASSNVSVIINGQTYSCTPSTGNPVPGGTECSERAKHLRVAYENCRTGGTPSTCFKKIFLPMSQWPSYCYDLRNLCFETCHESSTPSNCTNTCYE